MSAERPTRATLSPAEVESIRWLYAQPDHPTQAEIAEGFNVHPSQVSRLVRGISWSDADGPVFPHRPSKGGE